MMNNPGEYVKSSQLQWQDASDVITEFADELTNMHGRIIDIGCGPGIITQSLVLPKVAEDAAIIGADISCDMVAYATKHHSNDKVSFVQLDIAAPELPSNMIGQFDNIVSFNCLHRCPKVEDSFGNIYKLLRPSGKGLTVLCAYHVVYDWYVEQQTDSRFSQYIQDIVSHLPPHYGVSNPERILKKQLEAVGFKVHHCTTRSRLVSYNSPQRAIEMLVAVNPFLARMPEDLQDQYLKDIEMRAEAMFGSADCNVDDQYRALVAFFEKPRDE